MKKIIKNTLISSSPCNFISLFFKNIWLAFFVTIIIVSSCDNPDLTNFKTPLTNDTFGTKSTDTITLILRTEILDSIVSTNFTKDLIGCYSDAITGKTVSSSYFNFRLPSTTIKLPDTVTVKSVTLTIRYAGGDNYFGNLTERQTFRVHELMQKIKFDSSYYSSYKTDYNPTPAGEWNGFLRPSDTLLKIELSKELGEKLLSGSKNQLSNNDSFQTYFKGLAIIPDDQVFMGAIVYFLLNNAKTTLTVFYNDSAKVIFQVNSYSARYTNFSHDYKGSIVQNQLNNPKKEFSEVLLQPMSGTKVTIKIPYLKHMLDSVPIAIHKAEITFPLELNSPYNNYAPKSILLLQSDSLERLVSIVDRNENYYGGYLNSSKTAYTFIITRHIQQLLQQYLKNPEYVEPYTLTLIIPSDNPISAAPVIIKNFDNQGKKVAKLKIWYSRM